MVNKDYENGKYKYSTLEVITMLMENEDRIFEYPVPNHIGKIQMVKTSDGICFKQYDDGLEKFVYNTIALSCNTLAMVWKEIF